MIRIALRHHRIVVSQEPLHLVQIDSRLNQPRRKDVPEIMEITVYDGRLCHGCRNASLRWLHLTMCQFGRKDQGGFNVPHVGLLRQERHHASERNL